MTLIISEESHWLYRSALFSVGGKYTWIESTWTPGSDTGGHPGSWLPQWLCQNQSILMLMTLILFPCYFILFVCYYKHNYYTHSCSEFLVHMGNSFSRGRLLSHRVCASSNLLENTKLLQNWPKVVNQFILPSAVNNISHAPYTCQYLVLSDF